VLKRTGGIKMSKILCYFLKAFAIYVVGYLLTYPILFILFFTFQSQYFIFALCGILAVCGFFSWILIHHKRVTLQKIHFRNIRPEIYKEYGMQLAGVVVLFALASVQELFKLYNYGMGYYNFLCLFFDEKLAHDLSVLAIPDPGVLYFIAVSFFYVFYNIARLLFDCKLYLESK